MKEFILEANNDYENITQKPSFGYCKHHVPREAGLQNVYCNRPSKFIDKVLSNTLMETLHRGLQQSEKISAISRGCYLVTGFGF